MAPQVRAPCVTQPVVKPDEELSEEEGLERAAEMLGDEFDGLGFVALASGDSLGDSARAYASWFQPKASRRLLRFEARLRKLPAPGDWASVPQSTLKMLLRKGVPPQHRAEVWWSILGCEAKRARLQGAYHEYRKQVLAAKCAEEIERDLTRTFPNHRKFRTAAGRSELRNVLRAFAQHSPRVQYCQGLNFIAALLLVVFGDEERAFWALACAVECLGVEGYYTEGMTLLRADMQVLASFLAVKCPKVATVFQRQNVELTSICSEWYITWFAKSLPVQTVLRIWDVLFFEGFKVLFRVALGVFKRVEADVLQCAGFDDIMERAKQWPRRMVEHNELLKASFHGLASFRRRDLLQARDQALGRIEAEDEENRRRHKVVRERADRERQALKAAKAAAVPPLPSTTAVPEVAPALLGANVSARSPDAGLVAV